MIKRNATKRKSLAAVLFAVGLATLTMSGQASAVGAFTDCTPNEVEYSQGQLLVQCNNANNFFAQLSPPAGTNCTASTIDTIKIWLSMAQAAVLAQRPMRIYNATCSGNGVSFITSMDLNK